MVTRIGGRRAYRIFGREWIEHTKLEHQTIAERMEISPGTLSKLLSGKMKWTESYLAALAHAVDAPSVPDLYRHPDQPTPNDLLRSVPEARRKDIISMIQALTKAG